ncbi:MAG: hypothetical protein GY765_03490, partial [bacterium]|nr:hypothetical protein [bacterium]
CKSVTQPEEIKAPVYPTEPTIASFQPPYSTECFEETVFAVDGDTGFYSGRDSKLWSFSLVDGATLDLDGFDIGGDFHSPPFVFSNHRLAIPFLYDINAQSTPAMAHSPSVSPLSNCRVSLSGVKPMKRQSDPYFQWGIRVVDVSDPTDMVDLGIISFNGELLQAENIEVDADGRTGYIAGFRFNKLYAFDILDMQVVGEESLPGNPDHIKKAGTNVLIETYPAGDIIVVDVANREDMRVKGTIDVPGGKFYSGQNIVTSADNTFGFVGKDDKMWSFDIETLSICDEDGLTFENIPSKLSIHGETVGACIPVHIIAEEPVVFVDVSDPYNLKEKVRCQFSTPIFIAGPARVDFSSDGQLAAIGVSKPEGAVYIFKTQTGELVRTIPTPGMIAYLDVFGSRDLIGALKISSNLGGLDSKVYLLHNYMTAE